MPIELELRGVDSSQRTVLVVEDVGEIGSQIEAMLQRKGHRTVLASDAAEAIRMAEAERPAMILTDLDLPTFDLLVQNIRLHATLNDMVVAVIDINQPILDGISDVQVLNNFNELDELLASGMSNGAASSSETIPPK